MKYKFSKTLLLLIALSACCQTSPYAAEKENDAMDVEKTQLASKRTRTEAGLDPEESQRASKRSSKQDESSNDRAVFPFLELTYNIQLRIIDLFDLKKDQNTLLSLMRSCKTFRDIVLARYEEANKSERHYPWQDNPSLFSSTVYIMNNRMRTILGLYANIQYYKNMADERDRIRFQRLCTQFLQKSLFSLDSVPNMYVDFLQLDVSVSNPTRFQTPFLSSSGEELYTKNQKLLSKLSNMVGGNNPILHNEYALYLHYGHFIEETDDHKALKTTNKYTSLNGSLMGVLNAGLLKLKEPPALPGFSGIPSQYSPEIWETIIDLDPAVTSQQLASASEACYIAGISATRPVLKATYYTKAAVWLEKYLRAIKDLGGGITTSEYDAKYSYISHYYYQAGENTSHPAIAFVYFVKAAQYGEVRLKAIKASGTNPTINDTDKISQAHFRAGENAADPAIKFKYFDKVAKYAEVRLKAIRASGANPTVAGYAYVAKANFRAGENATDPAIAFVYFVKAAEYYEQQLKVIKASGANPTAEDYGNIAQAYFQVGKNAADPTTKATNYAKSDEYHEERIKLIKSLLALD